MGLVKGVFSHGTMSQAYDGEMIYRPISVKRPLRRRSSLKLGARNNRHLGGAIIWVA
jgi:hypothetical protein